MGRLLAVIAAVLLLVGVWFAAGSASSPVIERGTRVVDVEHGQGATVVDAPEGSNFEGRAQAEPSKIEEPKLAQPNPSNDGLLVILEDAAGAPLPGAALTVGWRKGFGGYGHDRGQTDEHGAFRTSVAEAFQIEDVAVTPSDSKEKYELPFDEISPDPTEPRVVRVRLPERGRLSVHVLDLSGHPQPQTEVLLEPVHTKSLDPYLHVLSVRTGASRYETAEDGRCTVELPLGIWRVRIGQVEGLPLERAEVVLDPARPEREVALRVATAEQCLPLRVTVDLPEGAGRPRLGVSGRLSIPSPVELIDPLPIKGRRIDAITTEFVLPPIGIWTLMGSCEGCQPLREPIPAGAERMKVRFLPLNSLAKKPRLTGRVVSAADGTPVAASIQQTTGVTSGSSSGSGCDQHGRFDVERRDFDPLYLRASRSGFAWAMIGPIPPDFDGPLELRLQPVSSISGLVVGAGGDPVDCLVHLFRAGEQVTPISGGAGVAPLALSVDRIGTGEGGAFHFRDVTSGLLALWVEPQDRSLPPARVQVHGGRDDVVIVLGDGLAGRGTLRGQVRDALTGAAVPGVELSFQGEDSWPHSLGLTDGEGRYIVQGLPPETYTVHLALGPDDARAYAFHQRPGVVIEPGDNALDLELLPARDLHLLVRDVDGSPLRRAYLEFLDAGDLPIELQDRYGHADGVNAGTDAAGRADVRGLPAGIVTLQVWRSSEYEDDGEDPVAEFELDLTTARRELVEVTLPR